MQGWNQGVPRTGSLHRLGGESTPHLFQLLCLLAPPGLGSLTPISTSFSSPAVKSLLFLLLQDILSTFRAHLYSPWYEHWRVDAFELWCWRRLFRVPWTARRSNQSILKDIIPEDSLEELRLKLKLQYVGQLMWRTDSLEKSLMLGKTEGRRGRQRMRWLGGITELMDTSLSKL